MWTDKDSKILRVILVWILTFAAAGSIVTQFPIVSHIDGILMAASVASVVGLFYAKEK